MYTQINFDQFATEFKNIRSDNFSYEGLRCLYEYLTSLEEDLGEPIELDVIALCCEYSEDSFTDVVSSYCIELPDCEDDDDIAQVVCDYLMDHGSYISHTDDTVIYQQF